MRERLGGVEALVGVEGSGNMSYVAESAGWLDRMEQKGNCISLYESRNYTSLSMLWASTFYMYCCGGKEEVGLHEAR